MRRSSTAGPEERKRQQKNDRQNKFPTALQIYFNYPNEIGNVQLRELFDIAANSTLARLKTKIRKLQVEEGLKVLNAHNVSTKAAYQYAGIDIEEVKKRYREGQRLGLWDGLN